MAWKLLLSLSSNIKMRNWVYKGSTSLAYVWLTGKSYQQIYISNVTRQDADQARKGGNPIDKFI